MRNLWLASCLGVGLMGCGAEDELGLDDEELGSEGDEIVGNQLADHEMRQVAQITTINSDGKTAICTGTLVGNRTVVTAKHCVHLPPGSTAKDGTKGSCKGWVAFDRKGTGLKGVRGIPYDTCWVYEPNKPDSGYAGDLAFIQLSQAVTDLVPLKLTQDGRYQRLTAYGYGRSGSVSISGACSDGADGHKRKISYLARPGAMIGTVTCKGDSGGPHLRGDHGVVALTSRGGFGFDFTTRLNDRWSWVTSTCAKAEGAACAVRTN